MKVDQGQITYNPNTPNLYTNASNDLFVDSDTIRRLGLFI